MYERHWQLRRPAFRSDLSAEFYYAGRSHQAALLKLRYLIEQRPGLAVVTGPAGSGKSLLLETFREQLVGPAGPAVILHYPQLSAVELLRYLVAKLSTEDSAAIVEESRLDVIIRRLEQLLATLAEQGRRPLLVIDDAQLIDDHRVWQALLLLLNLPASLSVVLAGPPELLGRLKRFGSLFDRLEITGVLQPLTTDETAAYVRHRLQMAGTTAEIFEDSALAAIQEASDGLPRRINRLCDFALLVGYADDVRQLTAVHIAAVAEELLPAAA